MNHDQGVGTDVLRDSVVDRRCCGHAWAGKGLGVGHKAGNGVLLSK